MTSVSGPRGYKRILVPLDGTPASEAIVAYVAGMAAHAGSKVVLLTCIAISGEKADFAGGYLEKVAAPLRKRGLGVATMVEQGEPGPGIVEASLRYETDLIAISSAARSGGRQDALGAVVTHVLRSRVEPVLILREEDGRAAQD